MNQFLGISFWLMSGLVLEIPLAFGTFQKEGDRFASMRRDMVEKQIRARGVQDSRVLEAVQKVPRHEFVPPAEKLAAYSDAPLPIGQGQTISQPYIVALMTELVKPQPTDKVLEIGTGSGYQAAVLAEIVSSVYSIEILEPLYQTAKERLAKLGYHQIHLRWGDGTKGWPEEAPFDKIIVTAAGLDIPRSLVEQLKEGGILVIPVGDKEQTLVVGEKRSGVLKTFESIPVRFVPLIQEKERTNGKKKE